MTVFGEIVASYRNPRAAMQRQIDLVKGEERLLIYVVLATLLLVVARFPALLQLANAAAEGEKTPMAIIAGNLTGSLFFGPLLLYALAAISHLVAKGFKGQGGFFGARLALFWALLASAPLALLSTAAYAVAPLPLVGQVGSLLAFLGFGLFWSVNLSLAERFRSFIPMFILVILIVAGLTAALQFSIIAPNG